MARFLLQNTAPEVLAYPPSNTRNAPTSVDYQYRTPDLDDLTAAVAATIDPVAGVVSAVAAAGTDALTFLAAPGVIIGREYLVTHPTLEPFRVQAQSDGMTVYLADPLPVEVPVGASLLGIGITFTMPATDTATKGRGIVKYDAQINGRTVKWDLQTQTVGGGFAYTLSTSRAVKLAPELDRLRPDNSTSLAEAIETAYEYVFADLEARGYKMERINSAEKLDLAVVKRMLWDLYRSSAKPGDESEQQAATDYYRQLDIADSGSRWWYDEQDEDNPTGGEDREHLTEREFIQFER